MGKKYLEDLEKCQKILLPATSNNTEDKQKTPEEIKAFCKGLTWLPVLEMLILNNLELECTFL